MVLHPTPEKFNTFDDAGNLAFPFGIAEPGPIAADIPGVPSRRGHDGLLISTALNARLDEISWRRTVRLARRGVVGSGRQPNPRKPRFRWIFFC